MVTTYNVRGLKDEAKLRHLINHYSKTISNKNKDVVACFQETYLESHGKIPYLWRGNFHLTPGDRNSGGCLSLLSPHINIVESKDLGNRAHILACQRSNETRVSFIVANIYAPCPNSVGKIDFFTEVFETISSFEITHECSNIVVAGDFNLIFASHEMKNRLHTTQEKRVASAVAQMVEEADLRDVWDTNRGFTWNRSKTDVFSTIDRILFYKDFLKLEYLKINWSLSLSDHGAVETGFSFPNKENRPRMRIPRLDPSLAKSPETSGLLYNEFYNMLQTMPQGWDPHKKLEFAKVCIRSVAEKIQADRKRKERLEEEILNEELDEAITILEQDDLTENRTNALLSQVEELRLRKAVLIEEKGKRLAERLGSKWYNEGEKSTRYFMRLLKRAAPDDFESITREDGTMVEDKDGIAREICEYYRKLYESFDNVIEQDDDTFFANISPISDPDESELVKPLTVDELRGTLQSCQDSSPGPDGIPYSILGLLWPIYGPLLVDAWNHSLQSGKLPPSHKLSYLKLIPKAGKDLSKLTNWRPISLSNCDHKIITKTYSKRMCAKLEAKLMERQTAYLKGRLINDNIRSIIATIKSVQEERTNGLLVSLDAKKAFDSVSHNYIENCLKKFGCGKFVPIFRTLYSELSTDIIINGRIEKGYLIKRGVKQGDALSCIIFIMCMEPLLSNIESNDDINPIRIAAFDAALPKVYAYADDVNSTIEDSPSSLKALFKEYERLTKMSGLELNADKTEIMRLGDENEKEYHTEYLSKNFIIKSIPKVKINGISFQRNLEAMEEDNVAIVCEKINKQLKSWSRRSLTTLGKILIVKTFGISQIIFIMQSIVISPANFKRMNALLYKFIWNKHYSASKAPERIKRSISNLPMNYGGLGMIDIEALDESLKIKALGRLFGTSHPFLKLVARKLKLDDFFNPSIEVGIEQIAVRGLELVKKDRNLLWACDFAASSTKALAAVRETSYKTLVTKEGQRSLKFFILWSSGARKVKDLTADDLEDLKRFIYRDKYNLARQAVRVPLAHDVTLTEGYFIKEKIKPLASLTTKEIRTIRAGHNPIRSFKIGLDLTEAQSLSWSLRLTKIKSTKHKNILLRVAHGDIYTNEKLFRFGMQPSPLCPRCQDVDTLQHKFLECDYIKRIWAEANKHTRAIVTSNPANVNSAEAALGAFKDANTALLTINAEILLRISWLKPNNYLVHPKFIVKSAIATIIKNEKQGEVKDIVKSICDRMVT